MPCPRDPPCACVDCTCSPTCECAPANPGCDPCAEFMKQKAAEKAAAEKAANAVEEGKK